MRTRVIILVAAAGLASVSGACTHRLQRTLVPPSRLSTLDGKSPFLKAHLRDGRVYVLSRWRSDPAAEAVEGEGVLLDVNRLTMARGPFRVPADSVALFETNVTRPSGASTALTVFTGITAAVAVACAFNPKACFGSCPTFYAPGEDGRPRLQAEGFSASIAPGLEATDVDMLLHARATSREYVLRVTNEAFETHVIRRADLLAAPRPPGGRVYVTSDGAFRQAFTATSPTACRAAEGDCVAAVRAADGVERFSLADSTDLAARETIDLEFERPPAGELGLVVASRQTLVTTFLIYQALAYLGSDAAHRLATLRQRSETPDLVWGVGRALGGIEVLVENPAGDWVPAGHSGETGPIAVDTRVVPLPTGATAGRPYRVRLRLTRGLWRLDQVALVALGGTVQPVRVPPSRVRRIDGPALPDTARPLQATPLVTLPGDAYDIAYRLPEHPESYELFLEATGYYLEWMRREWLAEENPALAARLLLDPRSALRALAPEFKRLEPGLEQSFWSSRYVQH